MVLGSINWRRSNGALLSEFFQPFLNLFYSIATSPLVLNPATSVAVKSINLNLQIPHPLTDTNNLAGCTWFEHPLREAGVPSSKDPIPSIRFFGERRPPTIPCKGSS